MGRLKALLPWGDRTLLEHQIGSLLSAGVSTVVVVVGHRRDELEPLIEGIEGVSHVYNPDYRRGKTTSIRAGLRALASVPHDEDDALLLLNVDQPRSAETIRRVIGLHDGSHTGRRGGFQTRPYLITIPTHAGKGGHPVVLSASLIPELAEISEDTFGLKAVIRDHAAETRRVEVDSSEILLDLNTPEEYERALRTISPG